MLFLQVGDEVRHGAPVGGDFVLSSGECAEGGGNANDGTHVGLSPWSGGAGGTGIPCLDEIDDGGLSAAERTVAPRADGNRAELVAPAIEGDNLADEPRTAASRKQGHLDGNAADHAA